MHYERKLSGSFKTCNYVLYFCLHFWRIHALKIIYLKIKYYNLKFGLFLHIIKRHVIFMIYYYIHFHLLRTIYHMSQVWSLSIMLYYVHTYMSYGNLKTKFVYNTYEYLYKIVTFQKKSAVDIKIISASNYFFFRIFSIL